MWFFQRRNRHTLISQQEQEGQQEPQEPQGNFMDEEEDDHNHNNDHHHEVTLVPSSSQTSLGPSIHNQDPENIELTHHHHQNNNNTNDNNDTVEEQFQDHPSDMTQDNNEPWQEQLRYSYERKTFLCNVFTIFVLFQMWIGWNSNTDAGSSNTSTNGDNSTTSSSTVEGLIVTSLFSLIVIGVNIQMRHFYHEQWQEQSSQVFSLLPNSTVTRTDDSSDDNETHHHDLELQSSSLSSRQQQQPRFFTWDDILHLSQQSNGPNNNHSHHVDVSMLSYQAQLAYAIMESQRYIIETGGYGHPDGPEHKQGVSIETIQSWKTFSFDPMVGGTVDTTGTTSSTTRNTVTKSSTKPSWEKEGPTCCICLCEYETNEQLKEITPCGHWYHSDCILGWVKHHNTCPLCQVQLE